MVALAIMLYRIVQPILHLIPGRKRCHCHAVGTCSDRMLAMAKAGRPVKEIVRSIGATSVVMAMFMVLTGGCNAAAVGSDCQADVTVHLAASSGIVYGQANVYCDTQPQSWSATLTLQ